MDKITKERVLKHVQGAMDQKIHKLTIDNPFSASKVRETNPFGYRVVPIEVWIGSKFERSFVTTLGQGIFEQIGKIIAEGTGAYAENQNEREVTINTFRTETIDTMIQNQRRTVGRGKIYSPDLGEELRQLNNLNNESYKTKNIISDLYIRRNDGHEEFYSFKTVKPNLDQTAEAKKILLTLRTAIPDSEAFFALPYNPAGEGKPYSKAGHSLPKKLFDMDDLNFVLLGSSLWNKIGGSGNTYNILLEIFSKAGEKSSQRIRHEYFGFEE